MITLWVSKQNWDEFLEQLCTVQWVTQLQFRSVGSNSFSFFSPAKELLKSTEFLPFPDGKFSMDENQHNGPSWQSSVTSLITAQIGLFTSDDKTTFDIFRKITFAICKYPYVTSQIKQQNFKESIWDTISFIFV